MTELVHVMILVALIANLVVLVRVCYLLAEARDSLRKIRDSVSRTEVRLELQKDV